jgi:Raf kinase inhibitor-like YbhB/YbcL family protein
VTWTRTIAAAVPIVALACAAQPAKQPAAKSPEGRAGSSEMTLTSTAFAAGEPIPRRYSGYGDSVSPQLQWDNVPGAAKSLALVCRDPDAPGRTFIHWVIFNIPGDQRALPEGLPTRGVLSTGAVQGVNSAGRIGYTGPRPPSGIHRYFFDLCALDILLPLDSTADASALTAAMDGHVLGQAELMGTYSK